MQRTAHQVLNFEFHRLVLRAKDGDRRLIGLGTATDDLGDRFGFGRVIDAIAMRVSRNDRTEPGLTKDRQPQLGPHARVRRVTFQARSVIFSLQPS